MIIDRKQFKLNNKCVIEKLLIKTPFKYGAVFQDEACFLYIKDGASTLSSPTEKLSVQISESVLLKCGNYFAEIVQNTVKQTCEVFAVHLHPNILKEIYQDEIPGFIKPDNRKQYAQKIEREDIIIHFIASLDFYFQNPTLVNDDLLKLKLKELILLLLQTNNADDIISLFSHLFTPRKASLHEVVQTHLFSDISVSELAILAGRSLSAFKRDFETQFKDTPANYIRRQKLIRASDLLRTTDFSITEISYLVGFSDNSHFTELFKQTYNSTPLLYRKSNRSI